MKAAPSYPHAKSPDTFHRGLDYQDFVCLTLAKQHIILQNMASMRFQFDVGENLQGWEIKLDEPCTRTQRLSIEIAEKSRNTIAEWTPSGIYRNDNTWLYIQGNYDVIFIFALNWLRIFHRAVGRNDEHESFGTVRKFYLPFDKAAKGAAKVLYPGASA